MSGVIDPTRESPASVRSVEAAICALTVPPLVLFTTVPLTAATARAGSVPETTTLRSSEPVDVVATAATRSSTFAP